MADVKTLTISSGTYNIKDETARTMEIEYDRLNTPLGVPKPPMVTDYVSYTSKDNLTGDSTLTMEGGVWIPEDSIYIIAFSDTNRYNVTFVATSDFETPLYTFTLPVGHANSLTYNPNTNMLYTACMDEGAYPDTVVAIGYVSHAVEDSYSFTGAWGVAYDRDNDLMYVGDGSGLNICESDFTIKDTVSFTPANYVTDSLTHVTQDIEVYDGKLYYLGLSRYNSVWQNIILFSFTDSLTVDHCFAYRTTHRGEEAEWITVKDDQFMIGTGQNLFNLKHIILDTATGYQPTTIFDAPIPITTSTDLDDYKICGVYSVSSATETATLTNVPTAEAFTLYVTPLLSYDLSQTIVTATGVRFYRRHVASTDTWNNWQPFVSCYTIGDTISLPEQSFGQITNSLKNLLVTIPLSRYVDSNVSTLTISATFTARGITGTFLSGASTDDYTVTVSRNASGLRILIASSSAFTADAINNTPIVIGWSGTVTLA